ncbi:hypothetical protein RRG08_048111 [Elysia crispata]|uniref:Uncharacterized protein n=1 Tax=Elysia crispata TaxID=231223 RepID=A0AAE0XPT2_9GAST|nr:hypothetical protein RRG08_048111 [Elysia crispata]
MPNKHKLSNGTLLDGLACLTGKVFIPAIGWKDSARGSVNSRECARMYETNEYWALVLKLKSADTSYSSRSCSTSSREHSRAVCTV